MAEVEALGPLRQTIYENTYRTEPTEEARFRVHRVQAVLRELLKERLEGQSYDPVRCSQTTKRLADDIRERCKALGFERHKLMVHVTLGELKGQAFTQSSRCLWDTATDGWASESFKNESLFCTAQAFFLYFE
ncbi:tctex1 domain-containing 2 [Micractinium conductrix]|uniref:Tctex1 domain-containing 2 n=1 Tax=Micractinium conductrix TaxID=554055 RepID=A0A2P6VK78_9CHLO|nr:tctex1 domain-containing 2 [Micractinium conductrix]|eukprot:PSC74499.1 tctex1 domain-containing 2 [Micractinium conductrix]